MDRIEPEQPQEVVDLPQDSILHQKDINAIALRGYFGKEILTLKEEDQLSDIFNLVTGGEPMSMAEVLLYLRSVESNLGVAPLGETRITQMHNYLSVLGSIHKLTEEKKHLEL